MKITFKKNITFKDKPIFSEGESFDFDRDINIISGTNGIGKTSLLTAIRMLNKQDKNYLARKSELVDSIETDKDYKIYSYFASEDDTQGIGMTSMDLYLNGNGLSRNNHSQGESMLIGLSLVIKKIREDLNPKEDVVILLDEIDRNLDYDLQFKLFDILKMLSGYGTIIYITHNHLILSHFESFNLNERKWLDYNDLLTQKYRLEK